MAFQCARLLYNCKPKPLQIVCGWQSVILLFFSLAQTNLRVKLREPWFPTTRKLGDHISLLIFLSPKRGDTKITAFRNSTNPLPPTAVLRCLLDFTFVLIYHVSWADDLGSTSDSSTFVLQKTQIQITVIWSFRNHTDINWRIFKSNPDLRRITEWLLSELIIDSCS